MPLLQYGEEWRKQRRFAHMALSPDAVKKYDSVGDCVAKYVNSLLDNPDDFERQLRLFVHKACESKCLTKRTFAVRLDG